MTLKSFSGSFCDLKAHIWLHGHHTRAESYDDIRGGRRAWLHARDVGVSAT